MRKTPVLKVKSKSQFFRQLIKGETTVLKHAIDSFSWGIEKNKQTITVFELDIEDLNAKIMFKLNRGRWSDILKQMHKKTIEYEMYEYSGQINDLLEKLNKTETNKKNKL